MSQQNVSLAMEWRRLRRAATIVGLFTAPAFFLWLYSGLHWSLPVALIVTAFGVAAFRGLIDVVVRRLLPWPSMYGADDELAEEDVVARRRVWFWRKFFKRTLTLVVILFGALLALNLVLRLFGTKLPLFGTLDFLGPFIAQNGAQLAALLLQLPFFLLINVLIFIGPLMFANIKQIRGYEPGDADWGVKLADVRGQAEPKQEVARVVNLWQSGEEFEQRGGKRERGMLFLGAPGTGKTMLAKAIATNFNSPFVTIPGSGFAQTFIGMDVILVRFLVRKAKKLARKWGGQCIIFIDEIDAVGMRRQALGGNVGGMSAPSNPTSIHDVAFYGQMGSIHPNGELLVETRAWRERLFAERAAAQRSESLPPLFPGLRRFVFPGGMGGFGGGMALNQLLIVMDGVDDPPWRKRFFTNKVNTFLDATYIVPQKIGRVSLRVRRPKPPTEQVFFVGATNVPISSLDPALIRPGRMGRHIWFRTPTKEDRKDIFELYITKVAHAPDLDTPKRRDEMARITHGYSPAMIEQVCSMALTYAHSDGRMVFEWPDLVEAMTTVESGTAVGVEYQADDTRAVAIHEAGHALASHVYMQDLQSTRLSIRMRGSSLGHHQAAEKDERFSHWRHRQFGELVWILGAMAAEHSFYKENSTGVSGDVQSATATAALMAGVWAMGPEPIEFKKQLGPAREAEERKRIMGQFEALGTQIMNRLSMGSVMSGDPIAGILADQNKRKTAAQLLGQAYVAAYNTVDQNRRQVEQIAEELIERKEMHGDEVVDLLERVGITKPDIDYLDPKAWPKI
ncbi:MAG: AAA family ATPase [Solirubrobacteraceae bacterium]